MDKEKNGFEVYTSDLIPISEQETYITYDKATNEWMLFTNNPEHIEKWKLSVVPSAHFRSSKGFDRNTGKVIEIEGCIQGDVEVFI